MKYTRAELTFAIIATLALSLGYVATDIYLPALPELRNALGVSIPQAQQTLGIYFFGLALSQLIAGAIIDHFGYRKMGLICCIGFIVASIFCTLANSLGLLLIGRLLQALFAGMLSIIARASFIKRYSPEKAAQLFMMITPTTALSPAIAPVLGGFLAHHWHWQSTFVFLVIMASCIIVGWYLVFRLPEDSGPSSQLKLSVVVKNYFSLLAHSAFTRYLFLLCGCFGLYFSYITEAPFIFHHTGYSTRAIGLSFAPIALLFLFGTQCARILLAYVAEKYIINMGTILQILGICLLCISGLFFFSMTSIIIAMSVASVGCGLISPIAFNAGLTPFRQYSGYASSLLTAIPFIFATLCSSIIHRVSGDQIVNIAVFILSVVAFGYVGFLIFGGFKKPAST